MRLLQGVHVCGRIVNGLIVHHTYLLLVNYFLDMVALVDDWHWKASASNWCHVLNMVDILCL